MIKGLDWKRRKKTRQGNTIHSVTGTYETERTPLIQCYNVRTMMIFANHGTASFSESTQPRACRGKGPTALPLVVQNFCILPFSVSLLHRFATRHEIRGRGPPPIESFLIPTFLTQAMWILAKNYGPRAVGREKGLPLSAQHDSTVHDRNPTSTPGVEKHLTLQNFGKRVFLAF